MVTTLPVMVPALRLFLERHERPRVQRWQALRVTSLRPGWTYVTDVVVASYGVSPIVVVLSSKGSRSLLSAS